MITSSSSATLNGKNSVGIFSIKSAAAGTVISNLKFINGNRSRGGGIYIEGNNVVIDNCIFENNHASTGGAGVSSRYNSSFAVNTVVKNCKFSSNTANIAGGALGLFGKNSKVINCLFTSNRVIDTVGSDCYGGAIQIGMDEPNCNGLVSNCNFTNNYVTSKGGHTHGGAGCIRNGVEYRGCIFINNSADEGGALTYHASGKLNDCIFISNKASEYGGALSTGLGFYPSMNLKINDCTFIENEAPLGGAVQLCGFNIEFDNCKFNDNYASTYGGALNMEATTVTLKNSFLNGNIAEIDGGAVFTKGKNTFIVNSSFRNNSAIPDKDKYNEGLGGAIYVNSTNTNIENNEFYYNTARNGSAVYLDKFSEKSIFVNNTMYQNQAWVYALPIFANDIYYGDSEEIKSIIHGGNNIAKYNNLAVSNAIYNAASYSKIKIDNENPINGATNDGRLYQDDREYNMEIELTVEKDDGTVVYNKTLNSNYLGEVSDELNNLQPGKYYVTAKHFEDTYYKAITNRTTFTVSPKIDSRIEKSSNSDNYNFEDVVVWTLNITNAGPNKATGVVVTDILPEGLIYIRDDSGGKYDPATGILNIGELDVGEQKIVNIFAIINKTGEIVNKANVTSKEFDINLTNNHDQSSIIVPPTSDLEVKKMVNNSLPDYNDLVEWTIVVKNNGPDTAHGVVAKDILPKSLIWISNDRNYDHITGIWNIGTLNVNQESRLKIICRVNATGVITNNVSVSGQEVDYDLSNNNDSGIIKVSPASDLAIVKHVNVSQANFNDLVRWRLIVSNNGPDVATGVVVTDVLPDGFVYVDSVLEKGSYSNGVINIDKLAVGESVILEIICKVENTGRFVNIANVTGNEFDHDLSNNRANASVLINPACDMEVVKTVNESNPNYRDCVTWSIVVRNNGLDVAHDIVVNDVLPKSLIWVADNGSGKFNPKTGIWTINKLNPDEDIQLDIITMVNQTGTVENNVSVSAREFDYDLSNNNDSEIIDVSPASDLAIVKQVNVSQANFNDLVRWKLSVSNNGPDVATGVVVTDVLPDGFVYVDSVLEKGSYSDGVINIGRLAVGESVILEIICKVENTGRFVNIANVTGNEFDYDLSNNRANASVLINPACDMEVEKTVNESNPNYRDNVTWSIVVRNNGPDVAHDVIVNDVLPGSLIWISDDSNGKYNPRTGIWTIAQLNCGVEIRLNIVAMVNGTGITQNNVSVTAREFDYDLSNNNASEIVEVNKTADVSIVKIVDDSNPLYGNLITWTLIAKNNGPDKATSVAVEDILPKGLILVDVVTTKGFYDKGVWYLCCLENGEEESLDIICEVNTTGNITNYASITAEEDDPNIHNNVDNETIDVPLTVDLEVVKQVSNKNPYYGENIIWFISIKNNGPDNATNVVLNDLLDENLIYNYYTASVGQFIGNNWVIEQLNSKETAYLNISCMVNGLGIIYNHASANCSEYDLNMSNNNDSEFIDALPVADLSVIKIVNVSNPNYGEFIKWTVIVSNNGPNNASGVIVRDTMPKGITLIKASDFIYSDGTWYVGDLVVGEVRELDMICKVSATGTFTNFASVQGNEFDPDVDNNNANESIFVNPACDLIITKTASKYYYKLGDIITYSIKLTNNGPDDARKIEVNDVHDDSLVLKSFKASKGSFNKLTQTWSINKLAAGESAELLVDAIATGKGIVKNIVSATSETFDYNLDNNEDVEIVNVTENDEIPKKPVNKTPNTTNNDEIVKNSEISVNNFSLLESNVAGNPFVFLVLSIVFLLMIVGNNFSKKR
ncbi:hypothetical protein [Methanobrevibacter sp. UBA188]|uniref:DUF11 domain-containing protein n=1 Tax=Methanobrevibacter sp. UBA188 TaxID=1915473 RepID=UPI0025FAA3C9|nr:hypothetical protein [Methanobrevibacter sp. UBA188]